VVYDTDGLLREADGQVPRFHLERCAADKARDIQHLKADGRYALMFPLDKSIPDPYLVKGLTVRLKWDGVPLAKLNLEDSRQHVVSHSEKDGHCEAIVKIGPRVVPSSQPAYPISGPQFAPYLAETDYIMPHDARVAETARKITKDSKTALAAVEALSKWISENVHASLIAETLTGAEVLAYRKGKCSEYAIVFASLARSVGIPTRIVLGMRMIGGPYCGHMWNEAYVGEWIPVDTAVNEVGGSCALLKLTHSDSVMGTQEVRWGLTDSLEVAVVQAETRPSPLEGRYTTGVEGQVYTNADHSCRFTAPAGWKFKDASKPSITMLRLVVPGEGQKVQVHIVLFGVPETLTPKSIIDSRLGMAKARSGELTVVSDKPCEVNGDPGHSIQYRRPSAKNKGETNKTTEVVWRHGASMFLLTMIAEESLHEKYAKAYADLLASYEHLK